MHKIPTHENGPMQLKAQRSMAKPEISEGAQQKREKPF